MFAAVYDMALGVSRWRTSYTLAMQDIELRYRRSLLGPFWISASLVATMLALSFVFSQVFQQEYVSYIAFLGAGLLAWQLISAMVHDGCVSVTEHASMLQNVHMPLTVIAGRVLVRNAIIFMHNLGAVIGLLLIFGVRFEPIAWMALLGVGVILFFGYLLSMALGPLCTRFRDVPLVIQNGMQVTFYLTPIFWMPSAVSHRPAFTNGNPFYHLIELVRAPLLGHLPTTTNWIVASWCCAIAGLLALISVAITRKRLNLWL